jgi:hypothetical protein
VDLAHSQNGIRKDQGNAGPSTEKSDKKGKDISYVKELTGKIQAFINEPPEKQELLERKIWKFECYTY